MNRILLIEDSPDIQLLLTRALMPPQFEVRVASTGHEAKEAWGAFQPALILLDISLPDLDGFQVFSEIQATKSLVHVPVIFLTGNADLAHKVTAFSMGAEDYIVKPFNMIELRARIESKLRKSALTIAQTETCVRGALSLDASTQQAHLMIEGQKQRIALTPREFLLLFHLAKNEERVLSREQLLNAVWGENSDVFDRTVDVHISAIRKKLGQYGKCIESVPSLGYRFVIPLGSGLGSQEPKAS